MIVIFDLDGTLSDCMHRRHFVSDGAHDWDNFYEACDQDKPIWSIINLLNLLRGFGYKIYIFSGRSDKVREKTEKWLADHSVVFDFLKMRSDGDYTADDKLKESWLKDIDKKEIYMVFDDRTRVVEMWRKNGLKCLQVSNGDF